MSNEVLTEYEELRLRVERTEAEARKLVRPALRIGAKALFDEFPALLGFAWTQYQAYDDNCFCVHQCGCLFKDSNVDKDDAINDFMASSLSEYDSYEVEGHAIEFAAVDNLLNEFDREDLQNVFGSSVTVYCIRDIEEPVIDQYDQ